MPKTDDAGQVVVLNERLKSALHLNIEPIGIAFRDVAPEDIELFDDPMAEPDSDGRSGRVSAGCVYWIKSMDKTFTTKPQDHGNCSVGSFTHGLLDMAQIAGNSDVATLLGSGWVDESAVAAIPFVKRKHNFITYGPLSAGDFMPDVVLLRVNARQMMVISDAVDVQIEGKPQCHIIAIAKEQGRVAASVGCALSRARTGMLAQEMTCAVPFAILADTVARIETAAKIDIEVAKYAANDARRFAG